MSLKHDLKKIKYRDLFKCGFIFPFEEAAGLSEDY